MIIKGMFFDLDGTLCETHEANYVAYAKAFQDEGRQLDRDEFYRASRAGLRSDIFIPQFIPGIGPEAMQRIMVAKQHHYADSMHLVEPNQHLIDFVHASRPHHTMALVTVAKRANGMRVLERIGLAEAFDHLVFGDSSVAAKPDPAPYLKALELSALGPDEVVAFEDSESGLAAATAAGIRVIRVNMSDAV